MSFGMEGFIYGFLTNENGIRFRERLGAKMPGLSGRCEGNRKLHRITDPDKFWKNIHLHPEKYGFDCLRIVSLIAIIDGVYGLLARGYCLDEALSSIKDMVINGEETFLEVGDKRIYPLGLFESGSKQDGREAICLADIVADGKNLTGEANGWRLTDVSFDGHVMAGDIFFAGIGGEYRRHRKYGNDDGQNGFILDASSGLVDAKNVMVFGHQKDIDGRLTNLYEVMRGLYETAAKYDDNYERFHEKGGVFFIVVRRDIDSWIDWLEEKIRISGR